MVDDDASVLGRSPPWFVRLRAGSTSGFLGIGGVMHPIDYVEPHAGFNKTTTDFDIGLIKVRHCFAAPPCAPRLLLLKFVNFAHCLPAAGEAPLLVYQPHLPYQARG